MLAPAAHPIRGPTNRATEATRGPDADPSSEFSGGAGDRDAVEREWDELDDPDLLWFGAGLPEVGIEPGTILRERDFPLARALMAGRDPCTGERLVVPKQGIDPAAKVPVAALLGHIERIAAEAKVSVAEVLHTAALKNIYARADRQYRRRGDLATLRADHALRLTTAAGITIADAWDPTEFAAALAKTVVDVPKLMPNGTIANVAQPRRVDAGNAGYDITLTLPKSYSLLLAFAPEEVADRVEALFLREARTALGWLEDTACYGMRGWHGSGREATTVSTSGFLGWLRVHRTARPVNGAVLGDPHWHVHATVANMARGEDGRWSTIAAGGRDLHRHASAVHHLFVGLVRKALAAELGIRSERNPRTRSWEVVGIPDETLRLFSKRGYSIKEALVHMGFSPSEATRAEQRIAEQDTQATAANTAALPEDACAREIYAAQERAAGRDPHEHIRAALTPPETATSTPVREEDGAQPAAPLTYFRAPHPRDDTDPAAIAATLQDPETGLTGHMRRFCRTEVLPRLFDLATHPLTAAEGAVLCDAVLEKPGFVALPHPELTDGITGARVEISARHMANADRYTTHDVIDAEATILAAAKRPRDDQTWATVDEPTLRSARGIVEATQHFDLNEGQADALRRLVTEGRALDAVEGPPGTGKTTLMRAVRVAFEAEGYVVAGAATAAVAAHNLSTESGIEAKTLAQWQHHITAGRGLHEIDVLVLDEANISDDRSVARLLREAKKTGTRTVLIGDAKQLRGVGCGSLFGRVHEVVEGVGLTENLRQREEDERLALHYWRQGQYSAALAIWTDKDRLLIADEPGQAVGEMLAAWSRERTGAPDPHTEMAGLAMIAPTNDTVLRLNHAAQALRILAGELGDSRTYRLATGDHLQLYEGDHVMLRRNDRRHDLVVSEQEVYNGYRAVVRSIRSSGHVEVEWHEHIDGTVKECAATLSPDYIARGGLELGYAMTTHKAEGMTVKPGLDTPEDWITEDGAVQRGTVLVYVPGAAEPNAYVALSRHVGQVYLVGSLREMESVAALQEQGPPTSPWNRTCRFVDALIARARTTATNANDRPVTDDLADAIGAAFHDRAHSSRAVRELPKASAALVAALRMPADAISDTQTAQATDWVRRAWPPEFAAEVLDGTAAPHLVRLLHTAAWCGTDPVALLRLLPLAVVAGPGIRERSRFAAAWIGRYVTVLVPGPQPHWRVLDPEQAEPFDTFTDLPTPPAEPTVAEVHDRARTWIHAAWNTNPGLVRRLITGEAFDTVAQRLHRLAERGLDPAAAVAALPHHRLASHHTREVSKLAAHLLGHQLSSTPDSGIAHRSVREFGGLDDRELATARAHAHRDAEDATARALLATDTARRLRGAADTGTGAAARELAEELAHARALRANALAALHTDALWHDARRTTENLARACEELERRLQNTSPWQRTQRGDLTALLDHLTRHHNRAIAAQTAAAAEVHTAHDAAGPPAQRNRDIALADALEDDATFATARARDHDDDTAATAERRAHDDTVIADAHRDLADRLDAELTARLHGPAPAPAEDPDASASEHAVPDIDDPYTASPTLDPHGPELPPTPETDLEP